MKKLLLILIIYTVVLAGELHGSGGLHSLKRTKRYLTFPEGSTYSFAFCMTIKVLTPEDVDLFTESIAVATSYDLPNSTESLGLHPESKEISKLSRRQRSYSYKTMELLFDKFGLPGKTCVLRAICEGAQQLQPSHNVLTEIVRVILRFPNEQPSEDEQKTQWIYSGAYRAGLLSYNCPDLYPDCPISLIDILLRLKPTAD